jgi:hypothetical protein
VIHHDSNLINSVGFSICLNPPLLRDDTPTNRGWGDDESVAVINLLKLLCSFRVNNKQPARLSIGNRGGNLTADKTNLNSSGAFIAGK